MADSLQGFVACPEKQLLVSCARTHVAAPFEGQIRGLVVENLDWEFVLEAATDNSVSPLLNLNVQAIAADAVPIGVVEQLKAAARANTVRCLFLAGELHRILDLFQTAGILAIPYKGPVLAEQAYANLTLRDFDDLDVILPQRDLAKAHEVMLSLGYHARFPEIQANHSGSAFIPGEYNYRNEKSRAVVELHTELTLRHFPVRPNLDEFAQRLERVTVAGKNLATFSAEDALPVLCVHGSKDFWERILWIADVAELIQSRTNLNWEATFRRAESLRAQRMLRLGLALADKLLRCPLPEEVLKQVRSDHEAIAIAQELEKRILSCGAVGISSPGRFRFRQRMVPGLLAGWRYSARLAVAPAEEDWNMIRLPVPLAPLYVALRPLRLLRKYGWGVGKGDTSP